MTTARHLPGPPGFPPSRWLGHAETASDAPRRTVTSPWGRVVFGVAFCCLLLQHNLARCSARAGRGDRIRATEPGDRVGTRQGPRIRQVGSTLSKAYFVFVVANKTRSAGCGAGLGWVCEPVLSCSAAERISVSLPICASLPNF